MLVVAEIFGHCQSSLANAEPAAWWLVHLPIDHHHIGQNAGFLHIAVKLFALTATFADPTKNTNALLVPDHVVDHFGEQHSLAHTSATEEPRLAAALQGHQYIDNLD